MSEQIDNINYNYLSTNKEFGLYLDFANDTKIDFEKFKPTVEILESKFGLVGGLFSELDSIEVSFKDRDKDFETNDINKLKELDGLDAEDIIFIVMVYNKI